MLPAIFCNFSSILKLARFKCHVTVVVLFRQYMSFLYNCSLPKQNKRTYTLDFFVLYLLFKAIWMRLQYQGAQMPNKAPIGLRAL